MTKRPPSTLIASALLLAAFVPGCDADVDDLPLDATELDDDETSRRPEADELAAVPAPAGAAADCCVAGGAPGCSDVAVQSCVCDADPYCCNTAWDGLCVSEVDSLGCGTCETTMSCCESSGSPGCELPAVETCVCDADPYCCNNAWDSLCVAEVDSLGCGTCDAIDLVITTLETPETACPGEDIGASIELDVTNVGSADVTSMFHVGWYLSSDATLGGGDRLLLGGRDQVMSLAAGATTAVSINVNQIPGDATPGAQYLIVSVDELDGIAETDDVNNITAVPITIEPECVADNEWARSIGDTAAESVETSGAVATDSAGNVYVLGTFYSAQIDLGDGPQLRQGGSDVFLVSYDADGLHRWSQRLGGGDYEFARGVGVDGADNVYVMGETEGSLDLGGGPLVPSGGSRDLWVASFTSAGSHRWSQRHGAPGAGLLGSDLSVDSSGDLVVVGRMDGAVSLGGALLPHAGLTDMFVLALDEAGNHRWSRSFGATGHDQAMGVAADPGGGAVVAGYINDTVDFGTGPLTSLGSADGVVVYLDETGTTQWAHRYGSTSIDIAQDVALDDFGNTYLLGNFYGTVDVGAGPMTAMSSDTLMVSYGPGGAFRWARQGGGSGLDYPRGITVDAAGNPVATGSFFGLTADYGGPLVGAGNYDTWLAGFLGADGTPLWTQSLGTELREEGYDLAISPSGAVVVVGQYNGSLPVVGTTLTTAGNSDIFVASIQP